MRFAAVPPPAPATTFLILILLLASAASAAQPAPTRQACVHELVAMSPCLSFLSSSTNASGGVAGECCDAFSGVFGSGAAVCLCYFLWQPLMLGFPLNSTRFASLPSACPQPFVHDGADYFRSLCSGSSAPPDSGDDCGLGNIRCDDSGFENDPSPEMSLAPETNGRSSTLLNSSVEPIDSSAATQLYYRWICCFLLHVIVVFSIVSSMVLA